MTCELCSGPLGGSRDPVCLGCAALTTLQGELRQDWHSGVVRGIATDLLISTSRQVRALRVHAQRVHQERSEDKRPEGPTEASSYRKGGTVKLEAKKGIKKEKDSSSYDSSSSTKEKTKVTAEVPTTSSTPPLATKVQAKLPAPRRLSGEKDENPFTAADRKAGIPGEEGSKEEKPGRKGSRGEDSEEDSFRPQRQGIINPTQYSLTGHRDKRSREESTTESIKVHPKDVALPERHFKLPDNYGQQPQKRRRKEQ